jgi:hypothetical protein
MIVSAIINSIDYNKKLCTVMIPDLQSSADPEPVIREAALIESLGTQNSYKVGDKVWISFIRGEKRYPIVMGRILTTDPTYLNQAGAGTFAELSVQDKVILPANTQFNISGVSADYNSLEKLINKLKQVTSFYEAYCNDIVNIQNNSVRYAAYCTEETKPSYNIGTIVFVKVETTLELHSTGHSLYLVNGITANSAKEFALDVDTKTDANAIELDGKWKIQAKFDGAVFAQRTE